MSTRKTTAQMRSEWPVIVRETGLIEIACPHGIGHPSQPLTPPCIWKSWMPVHGCDGCCNQAVFYIAELAHLEI